MQEARVIIMGAAGRDFHVFLKYFKDSSLFRVVCFTQNQIPGIENRKFPKELAGRKYKQDIPFYPESKLKELIKKFKVDYVYLAYSDLSHQEVMEKASFVLSCGANFSLLGTRDTMIKSKKKLISITAVRTGCGKSQVSRKVADILKEKGRRVVAIRHPMPYGDLVKQKCQRFGSYDDLKKHKVTIEEREEYEPWIEKGIPIYAGVDYQEILNKAEKEAEVIIWDGGNNDFSFYHSDLNIVIVDPHRPGHELIYYPGFVNLLLADVIVINKIGTAPKKGIETVERNIKKYNSKAKVIKAKSLLKVDQSSLIKGKNVLIVEDGPTLTHGGMSYGAGSIAAEKFEAKSVVDAEKYAVGSIKNIYKRYKHLKKVLPAMGYSRRQILELEKTINKAKCDLVIDGTPVNLSKLIKIRKPIVTVDYYIEEVGKKLKDVLKGF